MKNQIWSKEKEHDDTLNALKSIEKEMQHKRQVSGMRDVIEREEIKQRISLKMSRSLPQLGLMTNHRKRGGQTTRGTLYFVTEGKINE